jgi:hypothetical protein
MKSEPVIELEAKDKIKLNCFRISCKLFHKLYWRTYENMLKTAYEQCHKLVS